MTPPAPTVTASALSALLLRDPPISLIWLIWLASLAVRSLVMLFRSRPVMTPPGGEVNGRGGLGLDSRDEGVLTLRMMGENTRPCPRT